LRKQKGKGKSKKVKIADLAPNIIKEIFLAPYGYIECQNSIIYI